MAMNERYEPQSIERRWQSRWEEAGAFRAGRRPAAEKRYVLEMFPYPSGAMHMGHARVYTIGDALARHLRMRGHDVLHPIGFDALGLPAENAAIKDGRHPAERTAENIVAFRAEMKTLGFAFDWDAEVVTADPSYYRWNQWFFLKMLELGIVYRREGKVNWCTGCATVIANEQVVDDRCERCGSPVVEKVIPEWAFRITAFAQDLLDGLDRLTEWPERITTMQRNWIGKSVGAEVDFAVARRPGRAIKVFTTRVDTIFGCTYVVLAPEHPLVGELTAPGAAGRGPRLRRADAQDGRGGAHRREHAEGGRLHRRLRGEPLHRRGGPGLDRQLRPRRLRHGRGDERARARPARLRVRAEVRAARSACDPAAEGGATPARAMRSRRRSPRTACWTPRATSTGLTSAQAREKLAAEAQARGFGQATVRWHLRDWGFSRQRYWGTPIPIVYCPDHGAVPVPEDQLPVTLPARGGHHRQRRAAARQGPVVREHHLPALRQAGAPRGGDDGHLRRLVLVLRALPLAARTTMRPFDPAEARRWLPVDVYVGGPEHAVMHLLYFRFWHRVMHRLGLVQEDEPVKRLVTQGIVNGPDGRKMSKRWGNVVAPGPMVARFGADTVRMFMLFAAPPEKDIDWSDEQVEGLFRFLVPRVAHLPRAAGVLPRARRGARGGARGLPRAPPQDAPDGEARDGGARGGPQVQHRASPRSWSS